MSLEGGAPDRPVWAVTVERGEDGRTVFRDEHGEPLVAFAVTRDELTRLTTAMRSMPEDDATAALLDRLATLHDDLDEAGG